MWYKIWRRGALNDQFKWRPKWYWKFSYKKHNVLKDFTQTHPFYKKRCVRLSRINLIAVWELKLPEKKINRVVRVMVLIFARSLHTTQHQYCCDCQMCKTWNLKRPLSLFFSSLPGRHLSIHSNFNLFLFFSSSILKRLCVRSRDGEKNLSFGLSGGYKKNSIINF